MEVSASSCVGVIPARAGSQGIPGKNTRMFLDRPLIEWSILSALESKVLSSIIVTTDCPVVAEITNRYSVGLIYPRPENLCTSTAPTSSVVAHAVNAAVDSQIIQSYPDYIVVLEPTSPGRRITDIANAFNELSNNGADSVASVSTVPHHYNVHKQLRFHEGKQLESLSGCHPGAMTHRRQDVESSVAFDGLIFGTCLRILQSDPPTLWGPRVYGIPSDPSFVIDLDEPYQWELAERQLAPYLLGHRS